MLAGLVVGAVPFPIPKTPTAEVPKVVAPMPTLVPSVYIGLFASPTASDVCLGIYPSVKLEHLTVTKEGLSSVPTPKFVAADAAVLAPVPPSAIVISVMPVIVPPLIVGDVSVGLPVQFVKIPETGVPRAGDVKVGLSKDAIVFGIPSLFIYFNIPDCAHSCPIFAGLDVGAVPFPIPKTPTAEVPKVVAPMPTLVPSVYIRLFASPTASDVCLGIYPSVKLEHLTVTKAGLSPVPTPKFVAADAAVLAPVPPSAIVISVMPVIVPPLIVGDVSVGRLLQSGKSSE